MRSGWFDRFVWIAFVVAVGFVCFTFGFITPILQWFPYALMSRALHELPHLGEQGDIFHSDLYVSARSERTGVVRYDQERAFNGYTLFTSAHAPAAFLIDMNGDIVHDWRLPYDEIRDSSSPVPDPRFPEKTFWRDAYLYPNGDVLAIYEAWGPRLFGYGLVKVDRNSRLIWKRLDHIHHDVSVGSAGEIYAPMQVWRTEPIPEFPQIKTPCVEGFVIMLSPDGKLLKKVSIYEAFARSSYRGMMRLLAVPENEDMLHTNSVKPLPPSFAAIFPQAGPHTVLISSRNIDTIAVLDLDAEKIIWAMRGPWARQHDARPLPNGNIMLFDDLGDFEHGNHSRVLEFEPKPFKLVWEFPGDTGEILDTEILGAEEKLQNGNVLITDSGTARMLEVTPDKKVVWEYRSPFLEGDQHQYVGVLTSGHRYAPGDLHFQFNRSTTSKELESAPGEGHR